MSHQPLNVPGMTLPHYVVPDDAFDELARGNIPPSWQHVVSFFHARSDDMPAPEGIRNQIRVRDLDFPRPWPLDPIPFVLADDEWLAIEAGLIQRADLLNRTISDLYQRRSLLAAGGLPPALLFGNPKYLLPAVDYQAPQDTFLSLAAFDLGRSPDGQWRVMADWTEAPQGLGMCLENRLLTTQAIPMLFEQHGTQRIREFLSAFASELQRPIHPDHAGETVILSPGPSDPSYFEHVYLGQYFGFQVVEGADLSVRGTSLQLKTLEGLKPVNSIWRYARSTHLDPLYLDVTSRNGVPGVVNVARRGAVNIANAIGTGVLENDAFMSFLPGLSERFLDAELLLPSVATWWCGQTESAAEVQELADKLSFHPAFHRSEMMANNNTHYSANSDTPAEFNYQTVAREPIVLSHSPYLTDTGEIAAGATMLRVFVARVGDSYRVLPGGIAKVATPGGEVTKDIWVSAPARTPANIKTTQSELIRRTDRDLPSRTADDLFWLGRYIERCDGGARAYRILLTQVADNATDRGQATEMVAHLLARLELFSSPKPNLTNLHQQGYTPIFASQLLNSEQQSGFGKLIQDIYHLASEVRERLSPDAWRIFGALQREPIPTADPAATLNYLDRQLERLSALNGQIQENMTRGYGWRLLELGRGLERGQFARIALNELVNDDVNPMKLHLLLELCDSAITYRARYQTLPRLEHVLHLLLLDEANPRSVIFQVQRLTHVMQDMPLDQRSEGLSESQRLLLSAYHEMILSDPDRLADVISKTGTRTQLRRVLKRLDTTLVTLSQRITETYFSHTSGAGRSR